MQGIGFVGQNLCLAYIMMNKTYPWHRFCFTKPISGICYVGQNHIWDLVVKICETRCFPVKKNNIQN